MRRTLYIVMALALVIGFTQCKKEQPLEPQGEQVRITLDVNNGGNNGTRADVTPPSVSFVSGDQILVASGGHYVGFLTHNGTIFSGDITDPVVGEPLYFYFLGNKADVSGLTKGSSTTCTVNISDQTGYPAMPVISMGVSIDRTNHNATVNYSSLVDSYEAQLHNKASLMKFNVTTPSEAAICITGMKNKVTVHFNNPTDSGFEYNIDTEDGGLIKMKGQTGSGTKTYWAIVLPQSELSAGAEGSSYTADFSYIGTRPAIEEISANQYLSSGVAMTVNTAVWDGDLAKLTSSSTEEFATARDGMTIYGTLGVNKKVSIADGATVILNGVSINAAGTWASGAYAGITCVGDATIILSGTNTVKGFSGYYPGIHVPEGSTVTIKGSGSLTASSNGSGAGIGGGLFIACGNIEIQGGTITATGGNAAGIGSGGGNGTSCGTITISGGTVTATGGVYAAGIGSGGDASCGAITITSGVTHVTATKGSSAPNSIGAGADGTCGTVTIGGVVTGPISDSPYTYPVPLTYPIALGDATSDYVGSVVTTDGNVYATVAAASAASKTAVAIIAYVGTAGSVDATSDSYKGLAIALSDANSGSQCQWAEDFEDCLSSSQTSDITIALGFKDGISCTNMLTFHFHTHDAATAAAINKGTAAPTDASGWFMPSMGQWNLIVQGLASKKAGSPVTDDLTTSVNNTYKADNLNSVITDAGGTGLDADSYWASTEEDFAGAWVMDFWHGYATRFAKSVDCNVRSVIAF